MSKKPEDNRDVFDKIADYAAPVAGAVLGGKIGKRLGASKKAINRAHWNNYDASWKQPFSSPTNLDKALKADAKFEGLKRRRVVGGVAGATSGMAGGYVGGQEAKKRRK